ncbi:MAG: non-histone chromosomal MC1 family protein, partial [Methanosarcina thermophila]
LRERGTKKVHVFKAWKEIVDAPKNRPAWMPEKISKPFVKKERIEKLE